MFCITFYYIAYRYLFLFVSYCVLILGAKRNENKKNLSSNRGEDRNIAASQAAKLERRPPGSRTSAIPVWTGQRVPLTISQPFFMPLSIASGREPQLFPLCHRSLTTAVTTPFMSHVPPPSSTAIFTTLTSCTYRSVMGFNLHPDIGKYDL